MLKKILPIIFLFSLNTSISMAHDPSGTIDEFSTALSLVSSLEPDSMVGDYMYLKKYEGYELLWRTNDENNIVIMFYKLGTDLKTDFRVSYYKSTSIVPGKIVIRKVIGNIFNGMWKNKTINFKNFDDLGTQGLKELNLTSDETKLLSELNIKIF